MTIKPRYTVSDSHKLKETMLEFPDNYLLIELCGGNDRNLANIEKNLGVHILRRGNHLRVVGDAEAIRLASDVLWALYERLESGKAVERADIDRELRMGVSGNGFGFASEQTELFGVDSIEIKTRRKNVEPRTATQKSFVKALFANEMVFGIGPAGTGKTYLAVATGVNMFMNGHVDRIILSRPAVEAGEKLGYLPGDMKEKVDPYMQPLYDALNDFLPMKQLVRLIEEKRIEIAPLAFMRGRTLSDAFIVLDEAQNATSMQMKMFLTRLGEGSRMVVTGDKTQVDLPRGMRSGIVDAEHLLKDITGISFTYFTSKDVVRHSLVSKIIEAYEK